MPSTTTIALALAILLVSTFTRSALGFGDALIAMPLLALLLGVRTATPLVAFAATTIAITILLRGWRRADLRSAVRLIVSTLVGIPIGLFFLQRAPESIVKAILGIVLIAFGLYKLWGRRLPIRRSERLAYPFGLLAGILGGAYNTNGPPAVIYATLQGWPPETFRATLQSYFLPTGLMIVIGHGLAGLWTPTVVRLYLCGLPLILAAIYLGGRVNRAVPHQRFARLIYAALVVMGLLLFL